MKILALEFSSRQRAVAVTDGPTPLAAVMTEDLKEPPLTLIETALKQAKLQPADINTLALGLGPGSYTGIRSSLALAQGWQLARPINLVGISSIEILAATAQLAGHRGNIHFIIDAQRHEYYHASWKLSSDVWSETEAPHIIGVTQAAELDSFGPDAAGFPFCTPMYPDATVLARMAATTTPSASESELEPIYLRPTEFTKAPPPRQL